MIKKFLVLIVLVVTCLVAGSADAQCRNRINRNLGNLGLRQVVVGNQLVTLDAFGNIRNRQFIGNRLNNINRFNNNLLLNDDLLLGSRRLSLSERLIGF